MRPTHRPSLALLATLLAVFGLLAPAALTAAAPLTVNTRSREEVRQFFRTIYSASENAPLGWTGSYNATDPVVAAGDISTAAKDAALLRINFFRAMAGVPAGVTLNSTYNASNQQAALMMSMNRELRHTNIPTTWLRYTVAGKDAAASSNLAQGLNGANAITSLMQDDDGKGTVVLGVNFRVGHRRWLLYPHTRQMGVGDVPGDGGAYVPVHANWILDTNAPTTRPATREPYVAFPAPGFAPYQIVFPRWSLSYPGATFAAATVTMTRNGAAIPVRLETQDPVTIAGEPTLVWVYDGLSTESTAGHPRPTADITYGVTVTGIRVGTTTLPPIAYNVTVFDPDVAGPDTAPVAITGPASPGVGTANSFNVAKPTYASTFQWRTIALGSFSKTYDAESGLDGLTAVTTTGTPPVVQTTAPGTTTAVYRLSHINNPRPTQTLTLPETFLVGGGAAVNFLSRLAISTPAQTARVQVSADDGASWVDIYAQAGTSNAASTTPAATDATFTPRSASLAAYVGRSVRIRFAYTITIDGPGFPPDPANIVGWFLDNLTVTGVQTATTGAPVTVPGGSTFSFTPTTTGAIGLQARGILSEAYPLEWGPIAQFNAIIAGNPANPARLINLSILTDIPAPGENFTLGYVVGGVGTSGPKPLVIRAAGPSLGALGVGGTLEDPKIELFTTSQTGENDNWGGSATLTAALSAVGAFPYVGPASKDAAIAANITTANNTVSVSSANNGTGLVIAEIYDATSTANFTTATPRLLNVSVRKHLGTGVTMGFTVGGTGSKSILIRAVGPTLGDFGVPDTVADPKLELFNSSSAKIGENDNWGGTPALSSAFGAVGAFGLPATSRDAAILATLTPGGYSVQVGGTANTTGVALVEVYEVP
jgi:hypothetical protein